MYLVSACLAGVNCRYDGENSLNEAVAELVKQGKAIPICPEVIGGLEIPRACCEMVQGDDGRKRIMSRDGRDFTKEFMDGAQKTLEAAKALGVKKAILKAKSPSCGYGQVYDGTFNGVLREGNGFAAELLAMDGIEICNEKDFRE